MTFDAEMERRLGHLASRRSGNIGAGDHEAIDALLDEVKRLREENEQLGNNLIAEEGILLIRNKQNLELQAEIKRLREENERLERARAGWEADALNYAQSRGCQEQMTERAEARISAALALCEKRLESTRSWSDVRTHDERNTLRAVIQALRGEKP